MDDHFPDLRMLKVPLLRATFVYPPNALLEPDFWCSRAELTRPVPELDFPADDDPDTDGARAAPIAQRLALCMKTDRSHVDLLDAGGRRHGATNVRWGLVENTDVEPDL